MDRDKGTRFVGEGTGERKYDLIVCGAGTVGMPATIFAARRGARILVLEHAPEVGGTMTVAGGQISAAGIRVQANKGIDDSPDVHYDDIVNITDGKTTKPFARTGARLALKAGAVMWHRNHFVPRLSAVDNPDEPGQISRLTDPTSRRPAWEIHVGSDGKRFVAEDIKEPLARETGLLQLSDLSFWVIYDEAIRRAAPPLFDGVDPDVALGWFGRHPSYVRADTVAALADGVDNGNDAFGRTHMLRRMATPHRRRQRQASRRASSRHTTGCSRFPTLRRFRNR